ncbi:MAG: NAD(P)H-dependent oxidoreductase [Hyphomicrobiales bacterium]
MAKILVIAGHSSIEESQFSRPFLEALDGELFEKKILSQLYPDWRFDVEREQNDLKNCRSIVFVFPFNWYAPPAILQKWFADILVKTEHFDVFNSLKGKHVHSVISTGATEKTYRIDGSNRFSVEQFSRPFEVTIGYIGCIFHLPLVHYATYRLDLADVRAIARRFEETMKREVSNSADAALDIAL